MENRRFKILTAFASIVAKHGINRTTMREVAQEAGYSIGTIYNEFSSKEALIDGLFKQKKLEAESTLYRLAGLCNASSEMQLRRFMLGYIQEFNQKVRQDYAFAELVREAQYFRYIGMKTVDFNQFVRYKVLATLENILKLGIQEGIFHESDISVTAKLVLDAFTVYLLPSMVKEKEIADIEKEAEAMIELIIKALRSR